MSTEITKPKATGLAVAAPTFMAEDAGIQRGQLESLQLPSYLKIVQKSSESRLHDLAGIGGVMIMPEELIVAPKGGSFFFTPIFFFVEFCLWNPIQLRGKEPAIVERSFDPRSEIARKAMNADTRKEPYMGFERRYVEHLNFIIALHDEPDLPPLVMSFSRGEYTTGRRFGGLLANRRKAPLFGCVFEAKTGRRESNGNEWYGFDVANPSEDSGVSPWVDEVMYERYKKLNADLMEAHASQALQAGYGEDEEPSSTMPTDDTI